MKHRCSIRLALRQTGTQLSWDVFHRDRPGRSLSAWYRAPEDVSPAEAVRDFDEAARRGDRESLKAWGSRLARRLIPPEIEALWRRSDEGDVLFVVPAAWSDIPFEALWVESRGFLSRWLRVGTCIEAAERPGTEALLPPVAQAPVDRLLIITDPGDSLKQTQREGLAVKRIAARTGIRSQLIGNGDRTKIAQETAQTDIVHFAGESDRGWDLGAEGVFGPEDIRGALRDAVRRPRLVFSNSCYGGSPRGTGLSSVAGAFMKSGATHVIGPAVRIDDDHAARFSELFYRHFFAAGGHSPAQGLLEARQSYTRTHPASTVPFLYRLFGDPRNHPAASGFMKKVPRFLVPAVAAVSIVAAALYLLLDTPFTAAQREVPHLKFLVSLGSSEHAVLKQIADSFGTAHGVSIEVVNEDPDTAAEMLNRGDSLDVASVDINRFARVRNPEILSNLSPRERVLLVQDPLIVSDRDAAPPGDTTPVFTWNLKERGKRLAVPFRLIVRLLFVKKSDGFGYLLDRDSSSPPATWRELVAAPGFRRDGPEAPRLSIMAAGSDGGLFLWECIRAAGGDPAYLLSPAGIDVLQFCRRNLSDAFRADWRNASTLLRMHHVAGGWSWNIAFAALANHGMLSDFEVLPGLAWDTTRAPFSLLGGEVLAVPRTCRNDSLAQEFIAFLLHPEIQRRLARQLFWIPVSGRVFNTVKDIYGPHVPIVEEALQYAHPLPSWWGPDIHSLFTRIFEACIDRQAPPPADIARLFQPRLDSLLSRE